MDIRESYDSAAEAYAEHLATELDGKPLDRHLLNRFAEDTRGRGLVADLGCGPGHVARYLHDQGVNTVGIDLSPEMIAVARRLHPDLSFQVTLLYTSLGDGLPSFECEDEIASSLEANPEGLGTREAICFPGQKAA